MSEWTDSISRGDPDAFALMVHRYRGTVFGVCLSMTGDFHLAEDLAQETFLRAFMHLQDLRNPESAGTWLVKIARNIVKDRFKKRTVPLKTFAGIQDVSDKTRPHVSDQVGETVGKALGMLSEGARIAAILFYMEEMSHREIADLLEISVNAVKNRLYQARKKLKEELLNMTVEELRNRKPSGEFTVKLIYRLAFFKPALEDAVQLAFDEGAGEVGLAHMLLAILNRTASLGERYTGKLAAKLESLRNKLAKTRGEPKPDKPFEWRFSKDLDAIVQEAFEFGMQHNLPPDLNYLAAFARRRDLLPGEIASELSFTEDDLASEFGKRCERMRKESPGLKLDEFENLIAPIIEDAKKDVKWKSMDENEKKDVILFFSSFSDYLRRGAPIFSALDWISKRLKTGRIRRMLHGLNDSIRNFSSMGESPDLLEILPEPFVRVMKLGEEQGFLDLACRRLALAGDLR